MTYPSKFGMIRTVAKSAMLNHHKPPSCNRCQYSFVHRNVEYCKLFKYIFVPLDMDKDKFNWYIDSETSRSNEKLCGKLGNYFKSR
jgi:hypothetical protein